MPTRGWFLCSPFASGVLTQPPDRPHDCHWFILYDGRWAFQLLKNLFTIHFHPTHPLPQTDQRYPPPDALYLCGQSTIMKKGPSEGGLYHKIIWTWIIRSLFINFRPFFSCRESSTAYPLAFGRSRVYIISSPSRHPQCHLAFRFLLCPTTVCYVMWWPSFAFQVFQQPMRPLTTTDVSASGITSAVVNDQTRILLIFDIGTCYPSQRSIFWLVSLLFLGHRPFVRHLVLTESSVASIYSYFPLTSDNISCTSTPVRLSPSPIQSNPEF